MAARELNAALVALLDFSDWVDARIWRCVETLTTAQFTQPLSYSVGSIRDQLAHALGAEQVWLARMRGVATPPEWRDYSRYRDVSLTRQAARQARATLREYLDGLTGAALREYYSWPQAPGRDDPPCPRWLTLLHVVNHGTDHRAQILLQLARHFCAPTLEIDLSRYWRARRLPVGGTLSTVILRRLFAYHQWAMARVWEFVAALTEEEFTRPLAYSVGSIQRQLVHLLNAERYWLRRLGAPSLASLLDPEALDRTALRAVAAEQERWLLAWLAGQSDLDMARLHSFYHPDDSARLSFATWQVLLHVLNHATEHRAQILAQLAQEFGAVTDAQDLIYYWWQVEAESRV